MASSGSIGNIDPSQLSSGEDTPGLKLNLPKR